MSDNKLLTENTIRRFMKLANTQALSDTFFEGVGRYIGSEAHKMEQAIKAEKDPEKKAKLQKEFDRKKAEAEAKNPKDVKREGAYKDKKDPPIREDEAIEEGLYEEELEEQEMEIDAELGDSDGDMEDMEDEMDDPDDMADMGGDEPEMGAADISLTEEEADLLISLGERLSSAMAGAEEEPGDAGLDDMGDMDDMDAEAEAPDDEDEDPAYRQMEEQEIVQEVLKRVTKRIIAQKLNNRK